jgi:hypothetical protein
MLAVIESIRDFREFLAAKKRKREPIRWDARASSEAVYIPGSAQGFANFRAALREGDFAEASERIDGLADALHRRGGCALPLPRKVVQNSDRSLTVFWDGVTVRAFTDGLSALVGGLNGLRSQGATPEILDMLAFQARVRG